MLSCEDLAGIEPMIVLSILEDIKLYLCFVETFFDFPFFLLGVNFLYKQLKTLTKKNYKKGNLTIWTIHENGFKKCL